MFLFQGHYSRARKLFSMVSSRLPTLLVSITLIGSCAQPEREPPVVGNDTAAVVVSDAGRPMLGHRFVVVGDFDGDGRGDTLAEHLMDRRSGTEAFKFHENEGYERRNDRLARERPLCYIAATGSGIDSIPLALEYPASGLAFMRNEGDLDGNGTDELSYVVDHLDASSVNDCNVVTLTRRGWKSMLSFQIREWQIPQLPDASKSYGLFGVTDIAPAAREDSGRVARQTLDSFSFISPISRGLVAVRTFSDIERDSFAVGESIIALIALPGGRVRDIAANGSDADPSIAIARWRQQYARR